MSTVLLLVLLIISIVMTALILIQRSEGGALGIGGGGGGGGFMSGRSAADSVSKMTAYLGGAFLVCSLLLSVVFNRENQEQSILEPDESEVSTPFGNESLTPEGNSGESLDPLAGLGSDAGATDPAPSDMADEQSEDVDTEASTPMTDTTPEDAETPLEEQRDTDPQ